MDLKGKTILITGGTGSLGKKLTSIILERYSPKRLIIFSRDELKQSEMAQRFNHPALRFFLGNVRDKDRLMRAFVGVDFVIHAAALKQVPAAEYNPYEVIKTNVLGGQNVVDAAVDNGVEHVVALSTDKAANPINLYGATKLCSDKLFIAGNSYAGSKPTRFSVVRYGNVMGSRGSVIPIFLKLKSEGKPLPITDERMTRFWITLDEGAELVMKALKIMRGGEIFVPKIPSTTLLDLAAAIGPECEKEVVGIRPGEKLHEALISEDDGRNTFEYDDYYVIQPQFQWKEERMEGGKLVSEGFNYTSENNPHRLTIPEIKKLVEENCDSEETGLLRTSGS